MTQRDGQGRGEEVETREDESRAEKSLKKKRQKFVSSSSLTLGGRNLDDNSSAWLRSFLVSFFSPFRLERMTERG